MTVSDAKKRLGFYVFGRILNMGRRQYRAGIECPYYEDSAYAVAWRTGAATA